MTKAKKNNKPWTAADDAEGVLMREAKTPTKEIARALGRTPSGVMNRIQKKKNNKPWTYDMRASCYRQSADMQTPYRIQSTPPDKQTGVLNSIQNTAKNQHQANRELDHSAYIEFVKGQLDHNAYIEFGEPDTIQTEKEKQESEMQSLKNALEEMEEDIKPSNWFPRLQKFLKKLFGLK